MCDVFRASRAIRCLVLVALGAFVSPATPALAAKPAGSVGQPMIARLIIDLQDELAAETLTAYRSALKDAGAAVRWRFHHLPLKRHVSGKKAALAALAARAQGAEAPFITALLARASIDDREIVAAATQIGLKLKKFAVDRASPKTARQFDIERKALVALGVRATPSAILNGRGLAGLPPRRALKAAVKAIWGDARRCLAKMGARDCEQQGARNHAGLAADAFDALVNGLALSGHDVVARPIGRLGQRYKVKLSRWDIRVGTSSSDVTVVVFIDPSDTRQRLALAGMLKIVREQRDRLVVKLLPRGHFEAGASNGLSTALALTAICTRAKKKQRAAIMAALASGQPWPTLIPELAASVGLAASAIENAVAAPETTVILEKTVRVARRVDARPGAVYVNGRIWLGRSDDEGLDQVVELARGEAWALRRKGTPRRRVYAALIAHGRQRSEAETDLDDEEELGDLSGIPDLGTAAASPADATAVYLFADFRSLASRAAFHILKGQRGHDKHPVRLHMASMASSAEPAVTASGATFVAAHRLGHGLRCAGKLFGMADPNDWRLLRRMWSSMGLKKTTLQAHVAHAATKASSRAVARLKQTFEMDTDPVIYIANRRYIGPIDEARIERAIKFVHAASAHKENAK